MKKENRKLSFNNIELRTLDNDGKKHVIGIIPYNSRSVPMWGMTEIISSTAFNKTLADKSVVRALFNHDENKVLGSTESRTLVLENTIEGLICRCELPNTTYGNDAYEIIKRGDVNTLSFGFIPQKWDDSDNGKVRTLKEVHLREISFAVPFPAYEETNSLVYMRGLKMRNIDIEKLNETLEKEEFNEDDKLNIKETINILNDLIKEPEAVENEPEPTTQDEVNTPVEDNTNLLFEIESEINT